jgi:O-antigen ligase
VATGTRGFFFALVAIVLVHALTGIGGHVRQLRYLVVPSAGLAMLMIVLFSGELVGKQESDSVRITTASQVMDRITPLTVILGNGFGVGVEERPVHMENSYLEIFHKQGVLGLLWWGSMFFFLIVRYRKARRVNHEYAQPLFLSSCFVAFESLTNPFINNPIGIFIWLIALVGLDVLSRPSSPIALLGKRELATS